MTSTRACCVFLDRAGFNVFEDDQAVLTDSMYMRSQEIILDDNQAIFHIRLQSTLNEWIYVFLTLSKEHRLIHSETGKTPLFIHSAGGFI